jgi:nicotinamidase/pyrazinamidase
MDVDADITNYQTITYVDPEFAVDDLPRPCLIRKNTQGIEDAEANSAGNPDPVRSEFPLVCLGISDDIIAPATRANLNSTMAKPALILVDIQNDFVPGGALAVPDGHAVVPVANQWIARFRSNGDLIVATQDWHPADHMSFVTRNPGRRIGESIDVDGMPQVICPEHCVQGTHGAEFVKGLDITGIRAVVQKGTDPRIDSYSGFFDNHHRKETELAGRLREADIATVYLLGLATDYCVKFTALDSRRLGFETWLIPDGSRAANIQSGDEQRAVAEMVEAGVHIAERGWSEQTVSQTTTLDPEDYPLRHMEQMVQLTAALKSLPVQVLGHWYSYQAFGSWSMDLQFKGVAFRILSDGKDGVLTLRRSTSKRRPYDWEDLIWERILDGESVSPKEIVEALKGAIVE